jgi:hypothetical protein
VVFCYCQYQVLEVRITADGTSTCPVVTLCNIIFNLAKPQFNEQAFFVNLCENSSFYVKLDLIFYVPKLTE